MATRTSSLLGDLNQVNHFVASVTRFVALLLHGGIKPAFRSGIVKISGMVAITLPIIFLIITIILESIQPKYDPIKQTISALVWDKYGWCQTIAFYLFAFVLASLAFRLYIFGNRGRALRLGITLIAFMSFGVFIIAIFPTQAPGALLTPDAIVHRHTAWIICLLFPLACFLLAIGSRDNSKWGKIQVYTLITGLIGTTLCLVGIIATVTNAMWIGALERIMLANGMIWCEVIGIRFLLSNTSFYRLYARARAFLL